MSWSKSLSLPLTLAIFSSLAFGSAHAQDSAPDKQNGTTGTPAYPTPTILPDEEGLIKLDVVVRDKTGKPISGLTARDFTLLDQGQVSRIVSFQPSDATSTAQNPPLEVILVLDTLGVNSRLAAQEQQEIQSFLAQNDGKLPHPVSIFKIANAGLSSVAQPSTDGNALAAEFAHSKLRKIRDFRGLEPASQLELQCLGAIAAIERQKLGRKLLVWIGPEWKLADLPYPEVLPRDEEPFDTISWYYTLLREARLTLYTVTKPDPANRHIPDSPSDPKADEAPADLLLQRNSNRDPAAVHQRSLENLERDVLATQSGGRLLPRSDSLAEQINRCIAEESASYALSFNPPKTDRRYEFHQLTLKPLLPELVARTSGGYYNQSYFYDRPDPALRRVTVAQLEAILDAAQNKSDGQTAHQLTALQLTERVNSERLASWKARLHGAKATAALVSLADAAIFLKLPAAEIPTEAPPDLASQKRMMLLTVNYLSKTVPKLPNLFATRTTSSYEEPDPELPIGLTQQTPSQIVSEKSDKPGNGSFASHPLRLAYTGKVTVLYRDGNEIVDPGKTKQKTPRPEAVRLTTRGTFGPLAAIVIADTAMPPGKFVWSHWEKTATGTQAVFSFTVPADKRHYQVEYCCLADGDGKLPFQKLSGYHGEIAIDPATGTVLRLAIQADLNPALPLIRSDILVEYGPVEIGGETYTCPVRSVSISRWRSVKIVPEWDILYRVFGAYATSLNDVSFNDYHLFRSQARMVFDTEPPPASK